MINVRFKKLNSGARLPEKATDGSAAYDLYTPDRCIIPEGRSIIKLGFAMAMPYGIQAQVEPRSGYSSKGFEARILHKGIDDVDECIEMEHTLKTIGCPMDRVDADVVIGKVDADYRGEVGVIINNRSNNKLYLHKHQRIAQITFQKVEGATFETVDELDKTSRDGGFGHSGSGEL